MGRERKFNLNCVMTTGERIVSLRKQKGFTQESLSEESGISLRTIQRIENGETVPRAHSLKTIATCLGVTLDELMIETVDKKVEAPPGTLRLMNNAGLLAVILPFIPLIVIALIWRKHRGDETVDRIGRQIMSFHTVWLMVFVVVLVATQLIFSYATGQQMVGRISPLLPPYLAMTLVPLVFVFASAGSIEKGEKGLYRLSLSLF